MSTVLLALDFYGPETISGTTLPVVGLSSVSVSPFMLDADILNPDNSFTDFFLEASIDGGRNFQPVASTGMWQGGPDSVDKDGNPDTLGVAGITIEDNWTHIRGRLVLGQRLFIGIAVT